MTRRLVSAGLIASALSGQTPSERISPDNAIRIQEFYRLAAQIEYQVWAKWSLAPEPLLLVTATSEYLTHHPAPPSDFHAIGNGFYARPRHFATNLLATFPAFGPPCVIVVGKPKNTSSKTSTPWLQTLMHEHFHQLQNSQTNYFDHVRKLGLSRGDTTGMWMLNYPFPLR